MTITITRLDEAAALVAKQRGVERPHGCVVAMALLRSFGRDSKVRVGRSKLWLNDKEYEMPPDLRLAILAFDVTEWRQPFNGIGTFELVPA